MKALFSAEGHVQWRDWSESVKLSVAVDGGLTEAAVALQTGLLVKAIEQAKAGFASKYVDDNGRLNGEPTVTIQEVKYRGLVYIAE